MFLRILLALGLMLLAGGARALPTDESLERLRVQWATNPAAVTEQLEREVRDIERPGAEQPSLPLLARLYWMHGQAQLLQRKRCERAARDVTLADAFGLRQLWPGRYDTPFSQMTERLTRCLGASRLAAERDAALSALARQTPPEHRTLARELLEGLTQGLAASKAVTSPRVAPTADAVAPAHPSQTSGSPESVLGAAAQGVAVLLALLIVPQQLCLALTGDSLEALAVTQPLLVLIAPVLLLTVLSGAREVVAALVPESLRKRQRRASQALRPGPRIERLRPWE